MIILEKPYISDMLLTWLQEENIPVLNNKVARSCSKSYALNLINDDEAIAECKKAKRLYTVSENALSWVLENYPDKNYINKVNVLKDKKKFRDLCKSLFPDFYYKNIHVTELKEMDATTLPYPVVLKPTVGFFSVGVYTLENKEDWAHAIDDINTNFDAASANFPASVIKKTNFIIEQYIKGDEYAIDAYYDTKGKPVILNIYQHPFLSDKDVSDRLYLSSKTIYDNYLNAFLTFLTTMNSIVGLKDFPFHAEFRISGETIIPIEINAMRFAGLCLNELACQIYGMHPVKAYLEDFHPDYSSIWKGKEDKILGFVVLAKDSKNKDRTFNFEKLSAKLSHVLGIRKADSSFKNVFGFIFIEVEEKNKQELQRILSLDLTDFLI